MNEEASSEGPDAPPKFNIFTLAEVLTVVSEVPFIPTKDARKYAEKLGTLLIFLTGDTTLQAFQFRRVCREVRQSIVAQHPEIGQILATRPNPAIATSEERWKWQETIRSTHDLNGLVMVTPIDPLDHTHIDPAMESAMIKGANRLNNT